MTLSASTTASSAKSCDVPVTLAYMAAIIGAVILHLDYAADVERIRAFGARAFILSGGPETVTEEGTPRAPVAVWELGVPVLGICYGLQTMSHQLGGRVEAHDSLDDFPTPPWATVFTSPSTRP